MANKNKEKEAKQPEGTVGEAATKAEGSEGSQAANAEMVTVPRAQLTEILSKLERLESASDKGRLEAFDNANKPKELSRIRLNVYENPEDGSSKVIMAWRMVIDEVIYNQGRGYVERQVIELTLEDGSKVQLEYRDFTIGKRRKQQVAEIISRQKDETKGSELFKVRRVSDQKEFEVDSRFIN
jgi:hypothetical protein